MRPSTCRVGLLFFGNILLAYTTDLKQYDAQRPFLDNGILDATTDSEFFGLNTFANLPYVNCLAPPSTGDGTYDIAILGAPFDTVSIPCIMYLSKLNQIIERHRQARSSLWSFWNSKRLPKNEP